MKTNWTVQREFDHEPAYIMQGEQEIARIPPESRAYILLLAAAPEMHQVIQDVIDWTEGDIEAHRENGESERDLEYLEHRVKTLRYILSLIK